MVVGAGLAGLAAAWELARRGHEAVVLERRSAAGGRAGSDADPESGEPVDTGQHVFLGCYRETMRWFQALGTADRVRFQRRLDVAYRRQDGSRARFTAAPLPRPFHLLGGLWGLAGADWREKLRLLRLGPALAGGSLDRVTVAGWLDSLGIRGAARDLVLEPLAVAALNELPDAASALPFAAVLRELLLTGNRGCAIGLATVGLADLYTGAVRKAIVAAGGSVQTGAWARSLVVSDGAVRGAALADGSRVEADAVVSAVAPWDLAPLTAGVPELVRLAAAVERFPASPILTVHLWRGRPAVPEPFTGFVGGRFHWLFNRTAIVGPGRLGAEHLCLVRSGAGDLLGSKPDEVVALAERELARHAPETAGDRTVHSRVVWETKATVSLVPGTGAMRPGPVTALRGFFLAGDWTRTGLPATIESAVRSGFAAARAVVSSGA